MIDHQDGDVDENYDGDADMDDDDGDDDGDNDDIVEPAEGDCDRGEDKRD